MLTRPATQGDLPALHDLLRALNLPTQGLADHLPHTLLTEDDRGPVALAALEVHGSAGLLRSVAVHPTRQGQGLATQLVHAQLDRAHTLGLSGVYLLTTTADAYFPRFGFQPLPRPHAPRSLHASREFQDACPATATLMHLPLPQEIP